MSNNNYRNQNRHTDSSYSYTNRTYTRRDIVYGVWKLIRSILIVVSAFLLVLSAFYLATDYFLNNYWLPTSETDTTPVSIDIPRDTPVSTISQILYDNGLVSNASVFGYYIDFSGYGKRMQAGQYTLNKTMSMQTIMEILAKGNGPLQITEFLIIEGSSVPVTAQKLLDDNVITSTDIFLEAVSNITEYTSSYSFIADIAAQSHPDRLYLLEGYLYPAKYEIYVGSSPETLIKKMLIKFTEVFNEERLSRADELGMTVDDVVILASIIERESRPNDFAKVSAVFYNRINLGMKLESCASVQYILGTTKIKLSSEDISINSKYNTYMYTGLPAGPICSPSEKAIDAALHPDPGFMNDGYLFFATKDPESGELAFSKTAEEHAAVVAMYEELWIEYDKQNGN